MTTAKELKDELRALRKESQKPVSRMRVADISAEIQRLKGHREETPAPAALPSGVAKKSRASVESLKEAKESEFPMKPDQGVTKAPKKGGKVPKAPKDVVSSAVEKKKVKLAKLLAALDSDDE
jgi:hypothetical protein